MKITFPHMGNSWIVIQALLSALDLDFVIPPYNSKRALNLGAQIAPESACLPLKLNLGNYIEAAEQGADTIVITGGVGPCRFGYYGELEKELLNQAGYPYEIVVLEPPNGSLVGLGERIKYLAGKKNSWSKIFQAIHFAYHKCVILDQIEDLIHKGRARFKNTLYVEKIYEKALYDLSQTMSYKGMKEVLENVKESLAAHIGEKEERPLKIGIVGEIYTILDPYSSLDIEKYLGNLGVEVDRSIYLSGWVGQHVFQGIAQGYKPIKPYHKLARPYLNHSVGGHGIETVGAAVQFARQNYDGIIHLFPLTCMPEIVAAGILPKIQNDYKVPIMSLVIDEHTGKAGIETRLEAFIDLVERSRFNSNGREEVLSIAGK